MANVAMACGGILILLGGISYFATAGVSITAWIPAFFGLPLAGLGAMARNERYLKHAMHGAAVLALVGLAGAARGIPAALRLASGGEVERPAAVIAQAIMALVCVVFLALAVRSFVLVRRSNPRT